MPIFIWILWGKLRKVQQLNLRRSTQSKTTQNENTKVECVQNILDIKLQFADVAAYYYHVILVKHCFVETDDLSLVIREVQPVKFSLCFLYIKKQRSSLFYIFLYDLIMGF